MIEVIIKLYSDGLSQENIAKKLGRSQTGISLILKRNRIKCRPIGWKIPLLNSDQKGSNNRLWLGDKVRYGGAHDRVNRERGKPKKCEVCGTETAKLYDWANLTGCYHDPSDYKRMCRSCHFKHDGVIRNIHRRKR